MSEKDNGQQPTTVVTDTVEPTTPDVEVVQEAPVTDIDVPEGREPFTVDDSITTHSSQFITMALGDSDAMDRAFKESDALAPIIASLVDGSPTDKTFVGRVSNVIIGEDGDGKQRKTAISKPKPKLNGSTLVGEDALLAITTSLDQGGLIQIPLVNSGFRIELRKPEADELIVLDEQLLANKGVVGRLTGGIGLTYSSSYIQRDIISTILRCMKRHNLKDVPQKDVGEIRRRISLDDYHSLILGFQEAIHPEGMSTSVPCLSTDLDCNHVTNGRTSSAKMFWVDHGKLTPYQLSQITRNISDLISDEAYAKYKADFNYDASNYSFDYKGKRYTFNYQRPSLDQAVTSGLQWVADVNNSINNYINSSEDEELRKRVLTKAMTIHALSQYGAWFKELVVTNPENGELLVKVEDPKTLVSILKGLYSNDSIVEAIGNVRKFIENPNPVTIGVPLFLCPSCNKPAKDDKPTIIPVDIEMLFFIHTVDPKMMEFVFDTMALQMD